MFKRLIKLIMDRIELIECNNRELGEADGITT